MKMLKFLIIAVMPALVTSKEEKGFCEQDNIFGFWRCDFSLVCESTHFVIIKKITFVDCSCNSTSCCNSEVNSTLKQLTAVEFNSYTSQCWDQPTCPITVRRQRDCCVGASNVFVNIIYDCLSIELRLCNAVPVMCKDVIWTGSSRCNDAYTYYVKSAKCIDNNECADPDFCQNNGWCVNIPGSAYCDCFNGSINGACTQTFTPSTASTTSSQEYTSETTRGLSAESFTPAASTVPTTSKITSDSDESATSASLTRQTSIAYNATTSIKVTLGDETRTFRMPTSVSTSTSAIESTTASKDYTSETTSGHSAESFTSTASTIPTISGMATSDFDESATSASLTGLTSNAFNATSIKETLGDETRTFTTPTSVSSKVKEPGYSLQTSQSISTGAAINTSPTTKAPVTSATTESLEGPPLSVASGNGTNVTDISVGVTVAAFLVLTSLIIIIALCRRRRSKKRSRNESISSSTADRKHVFSNGPEWLGLNDLKTDNGLVQAISNGGLNLPEEKRWQYHWLLSSRTTGPAFLGPQNEAIQLQSVFQPPPFSALQCHANGSGGLRSLEGMPRNIDTASANSEMPESFYSKVLLSRDVYGRKPSSGKISYNATYA